MRSAEPDLDQIVFNLQQGIDAEESFRYLFDRFHRRVYHFFATRGFPADQCLDLTQEAFLRVYSSIASYRGESSFETWLFGILANISRNAKRWQRASKRSAPEVSIDDVRSDPKLGETIWPERAENEDPAAQVLRREETDLLERAIGKLPPQMRRVLILSVYYGLSHREVAEALGLTVGAVKSHLSQGRSQLLDALAPKKK